MKKFIFVFWIFVAITICQTFGTQIGLTDKEKDASVNEWGPVTGDAQISIALDPATNKITVNQNYGFIARIKNLSTNKDFFVYIDVSFLLSPSISFAVISPSGKDVSPTFSHVDHLSGGIVGVAPGKVDGFIVDLQQFCKLDELGTYKITMTIQRGWPRDRNLYNVVSNPLFVTIVSGH